MLCFVILTQNSPFTLAMSGLDQMTMFFFRVGSDSASEDEIKTQHDPIEIVMKFLIRSSFAQTDNRTIENLMCNVMWKCVFPL